MADLPTEHVSKLWAGICWTGGTLLETGNRTNPLTVRGMPNKAGLYMVTWVDASTWAGTMKTLVAKSSKKIRDPIIELNHVVPPVVLTVGRSTTLKKRLEQHFGENENNNRVLVRLRLLLFGKTDDEIRKIAVRSLRIEWYLEPRWIPRALLERYGSTVLRAIFDLEPEH